MLSPTPVSASRATVVFADLTGSTGVFEALGNERATRAITRLTQWIGQICESFGGRVVKNLGDGVLALFPAAPQAVAAAVEMQRAHERRLASWPQAARMRLQVGLASGEVVDVDGDCYGDAVNVASRLSDLSGADQIWTSESVAEQIDAAPAGIRMRCLGPITIRGKSEAQVVYRIDWQEEVQSEMLTRPAALLPDEPAALVTRQIRLSWLDQSIVLDAARLPARLGRIPEADFVVNDPRVSRLHAELSWRDGVFRLADLSSYGTWVRFAGANTELALRRNECVLHDQGEIALGAPFADFAVPVVQFELNDARAEGGAEYELDE